MSKHTPGSWELGTVTCRGSVALTEAWVTIGNTPDGEYDCEVTVRGEDALANARLIAAAPDLLEVLEQSVHDGRLQTFEDRGRFRKAARAAIAKATGE